MNIIFHIPFYLNPDIPSGTNIRPRKILETMKNMGHNVEVVWGYANEREPKIKELKQRISSGEKFDLLYSESSTIPTFLTETHHLPTHPFLDFGFFKFCKNNKIPIGLYYRDVYWSFKEYTSGGIKQIYSNIFYRYDVSKYNKLLDVLFLQSKKMKEFIPGLSDNLRIEALPPGLETSKNPSKEVDNDGPLKIFYVGGLNKLYRIHELISAVRNLDNIYLTICCRKNEWESEKQNYQHLIDGQSNIKIVHLSGKELEKYTENHSIASMVLEPSLYRNFCLPIKLFNYLSEFKPIIASKNTNAADFIEENGVGWTVEYQSDKIAQLLRHLNDHPEEIVEKNKHIKMMLEPHSWEARVNKIIQTLTS